MSFSFISQSRGLVLVLHLQATGTPLRCLSAIPEDVKRTVLDRDDQHGQHGCSCGN